MASGRPVIAGSRVGGARDLVKPAVTGWVFESGNEQDLTQVLVGALTLGRGRLRRMGEEARKLIAGWSTQAATESIAAAAALACEGRGRKMPALA